MENGWQASADAWIADMGEHGDFGRRYVLDGIMLSRTLRRSPRTALDVGCGEGRFCRMLKRHGIEITGVDPTPALITAASKRDEDGKYIQASAERLRSAKERSIRSSATCPLSTSRMLKPRFKKWCAS